MDDCHLEVSELMVLDPLDERVDTVGATASLHPSVEKIVAVGLLKKIYIGLYKITIKKFL